MQLDGKCGVIFGVANDHSIAWHVGRAAHEAGARLAFNYQNERVEAGARELVATLEGALCLPCDLMRDDQLDHFFEHVREAFGGRLDFLVHSLAFARREDLAGRYVDTPRPNFTLALEVSVYSLVAAARRAAPLMQASGG
ncbi:MAG: SDR family oxidoreductase, partial [bacterium]|nr:SDR family oxidoreductase [bacterium]